MSPPGSVTALIGPNGAGKTTLFNLITNLFAPTSGEMYFYGSPLNRLSPRQIAALGLIRTFQTARVFPGMTVMENVLVGGHNQIGRGAAQQMLWLAGRRAAKSANSRKRRTHCSTWSVSRGFAMTPRPICRWERKSCSMSSAH